ncbi:hypothetical protein NE237_008353 [Protea cynaroides]|uniref:U-box domain-containing protein n=1 Tax=Protea cynaroides TaxID=273540 RepID=A0A9Q0KVD6_9MAGN|nr:hypothetical protein NE237_008353 [Protea cynaroides]
MSYQVHQDEVDVPSYFLCPISLQIMKDPVTVSSEITYYREPIEKWIFSSKNHTSCPVTKTALPGALFYSSKGIERFPTPKPPVDKAQIVKLLNEGKTIQHQMKCLLSLRSITNENERNRRSLESAGVVEFLASIVTNDESSDSASDEALYILYHLQISEAGLKNLINRNGDFIETLMRALQYGSYPSRAYASLLLKCMFQLADPIYLMSLQLEHFVQIVNILDDQISQQASKASLQIMINLLEAGAVSVLIEILLERTKKRVCEMVLVVLNLLCGCAEGRAKLLKHGDGIAVVSKKILRVSHVATDRGMRILSSISRFTGTSCVLQEMIQVGAVSKLSLLLQVDCSLKTRGKAEEMLRLRSSSWKNSSCIPVHLLPFYPSS